MIVLKVGSTEIRILKVRRLELIKILGAKTLRPQRIIAEADISQGCRSRRPVLKIKILFQHRQTRIIVQPHVEVGKVHRLILDVGQIALMGKGIIQRWQSHRPMAVHGIGHILQATLGILHKIRLIGQLQHRLIFHLGYLGLL